jgi:hypothetical protein
MHNRFITLLPFAASGALLLAAMPSPAIASEDKNFGSTVQQNIEVQTVDMNPQYKGTLVEGGVGHRSAAAVRRYMKDRIRPFARFDGTTAVGAQGGSSSTGEGEK